MKEKIAIVASGGGMGCSYAAGAVRAIAEHYKFLNPDIVIAGSGSAATLTYYAAGQHDFIYPVWSKMLTSKKFINLKRIWKIMNVDYLIDDILKKQFPLDMRAVEESAIKLFIATTNCKTGDLTYFSNDDRLAEHDIYEFLRASKSIPILYGKKVPINGGKYCDTYLSSYINSHIKKAVELGITKIVAIDNDVRKRFNEKFFNVWLSTRNYGFRQNYNEKYALTSKYQVPKKVELVFIRPSSVLKVGTTSNTIELLEESMKMGWDDVVNNIELSNLIKSLQ